MAWPRETARSGPPNFLQDPPTPNTMARKRATQSPRVGAVGQCIALTTIGLADTSPLGGPLSRAMVRVKSIRYSQIPVRCARLGVRLGDVLKGEDNGLFSRSGELQRGRGRAS